jgi:aminoglycoside phosphotransferase
MDRLEGELLPYSQHGLPAQVAERLTNQYAANLAKLHSLDYRAGSLRSMLVPEGPYGYVDFMLSGFRSEAEYGLKNRDADLDLEWVCQRQEIRTVLDWLQEHRDGVACDKYVLLHGDYLPSNVLYADNEITGIIDWELARVGDPMHDLGYALMSGIPNLPGKYSHYGDVDLNRVHFYQVYSTLIHLYGSFALEQYGSQRLGIITDAFDGGMGEIMDGLYQVIRDRTGLDWTSS